MSAAPHAVRVCAVVPVYNHERAIGAVVAALDAAHLPCILVDDGSSPACAAALAACAATTPGTRLLRRAVNGGKGAAVADGLRAARAAGYTHALQVDADGQHAIADVPRFLAAAAADPAAVVCGLPSFDESMPRLRFYARYLTHVLVWLNTLSLEVRDSMCGFRIYPLEATLAMLDEEHPGARMDFDIEVLVRLHWRGLRMVWIPTRVAYPADGVSHFRLVLDNALITRVHARLFLGMLARLPRLLARRRRAASPSHA
ncbi:MAG: glycosyltransferase family 2 protein [Proteobacteria bacterium]|nr:glycosyltransferase family 2 protein [Pseudomonadota bacterium]